MFGSLTDTLLGILVGGIACAIFAFVVIKLAKKHNALRDELVQALTNEQKEEMMNATLENCVMTTGLIAIEPKVGNSKTELKVLFYNMYYPNMLEQFMLADINVTTKQYNEYHLKQGDYIKITLNENGAKVVFN